MMLKQLYEKSEEWFAVLFIVLYVVGNSILDQVSARLGAEFLVTLPYDLLLLTVLFLFIAKEKRLAYYGIGRTKAAPGRVLYYVPLIIIATVNIWFGFRLNKNVGETILYIAGMCAVGVIEELIFRGLLYQAMCRKRESTAIVVTSVLFGVGHIVNLFNGSGMQLVENICQLFYAVAIGFLLVSVLYTGKSLIPCMITHAVFNSLSVFANHDVHDTIQIQISVVLCLISGISAAIIFRNGCRGKE